MVDSRQKGATAELKIRDFMRKATGLQWERVPASGALAPIHGMKGDLYLPKANGKYCVEVKHYKDDHFNTAIFTGKNPQLFEWWKQTIREAGQIDKMPLLIFKHDRSKLFVAFTEMPEHALLNYVYVSEYQFFVALLSEWLEKENPEFVL